MSESPALQTTPAYRRRVLLASLVGTTIEFFDFYIYATAAVLVFPALFFPESEAGAAVLQSLATFALAFLARPIGSALFGHFGDRLGRKVTLVAALLTMGVSTVLIGFLPTYATIGIAAPILLALCRFGQGLGLGGEWGGAVLLATENAPPGKRAWYGMFPQLGAPLGFILATGTFILIDIFFDEAQIFGFAWRIPFIASALLVFVGLWVRLNIHETPDFQKTIERNERVRIPAMSVIVDHPWRLFLGTASALATFVLFYLMTVFSLNHGTTQLGYTRHDFLIYQIIGVLFFALTIPVSALIADRHGRRQMLLIATGLIMAFGFLFEALFSGASTASTLLFLASGLALMGLTYGPIGTELAELFPTAVRYTGASLTFNLAGIFGASFAPYIATFLAAEYGIASVGYYLAGAASLSFIALMLRPRETETSSLPAGATERG